MGVPLGLKEARSVLDVSHTLVLIQKTGSHAWTRSIIKCLALRWKDCSINTLISRSTPINGFVSPLVVKIVLRDDVNCIII